MKNELSNIFSLTDEIENENNSFNWYQQNNLISNETNGNIGAIKGSLLELEKASIIIHKNESNNSCEVN